MKYLKKLATVLCSAAVAVAMFSSCEGSELFGVNSPDWLQERIDSIANAKANSNEDIYSIGATDYSSGWWADFSHYYIIPDGAKWTETFDLHINPQATNTYKNFALILTNDVERGGDGYQEYGAIRFDHQPSGNSEWGSIDRSCIESNFTFETDTDPGVQRLGGVVTLTVDRSAENAFYVEMNNGDVKKTYTLPRALDNLNKDAQNENIRCFLVVEGSYIDFLTCNIDQIRTTKTPDQQPVSMVLNHVPKKVLTGTPLNQAFVNVTATVTYDGGGQRDVPASELDFVSVPDFDNIGEKTIVAIYNKTYKEQNADKAITASCKTLVVNSLSDYVCVGNPDNTSAFFSAHSANVKIAPGETYVTEFVNHTSGANNWNNWNVVLNATDVTQEYAVVRADNYGWSGNAMAGSYEACTHDHIGSWDGWLAAMDGAHVTMYITNNGDGTADIKAIINGTNGEEYTQFYNGLLVNSDDMNFRLTIDNSYIEFATVIGAEDNSSPFFSAHSTNYNVPVGKTITTQFINHSSCLNNWNNWNVVLNATDVTQEYAVVRADNYGWSGNAMAGSYEACSHDHVGSWDGWLAAMDEAKVTLSVTNNGNGTADIKAIMIGNDGVEYVQYYNGLLVNSDDLNFRTTIDGSHIIFQPFVAPAASGTKRSSRSRR